MQQYGFKVLSLKVLPLGPIRVHVVCVFIKDIKIIRLLNHIYDIYLGFPNAIR